MPAMFPVPTVPARAVETAWKGVISPPRVGFVKDFADGILHGIAELPELQSPVPHGHENPDADEQTQHGGAPHKAVHRTVDLCNQFHTLLPFRV